MLFIIPVKASNVTYNRSDYKNYGVNKGWRITEQNKSSILKTKMVDGSDKIYDFVEVLTDEEKDKLLVIMNEFISTYNMDLVILIDSVPYTYDSTNEDYAVDFYDYNDFGITFENYSGILLFRNTYSADPYYDIYTFGNAQLYFSQADYDYILDSIYSDLHNKDYYQGILQFIDLIDTRISHGKAYIYENYEVDKNGYLYYVDQNGIHVYYDEASGYHYTVDKSGNKKDYYFEYTDDEGNKYYYDEKNAYYFYYDRNKNKYEYYFKAVDSKGQTYYYSKTTNDKYYYDEAGNKKKYRPPISEVIKFARIFLISGIITFITILIMTGSHKKVKKEEYATIYMKEDSINYTKNTSLFTGSTREKIRNVSTSSSGGSGGFSSHSGSSGGGHSSGGGRHG